MVVCAINRIMVIPYTINPWVLDAVKWIKEEKPENDLEKFLVPKADPIPERIKKPVFDKLSKDEQIAQVQLLKDRKKSDLEVRANLKVVGGSITDAEELVDEAFFLPHQFDKRGRVYHTSNFGIIMPIGCVV